MAPGPHSSTPRHYREIHGDGESSPPPLDGSPMTLNAALCGSAILGTLDLVLKMNMTRLRVAALGAGSAGPATGAIMAVEAVQANFKRWHDLQLNVAEYTPTFAIFMLYIGLRQRVRHKADSEQSGGTATLAPLQRVACWAATASQLSFCAGATNPSHPRPGLSVQGWLRRPAFGCVLLEPLSPLEPGRAATERTDDNC